MEFLIRCLSKVDGLHFNCLHIQFLGRFSDTHSLIKSIWFSISFLRIVYISYTPNIFTTCIPFSKNLTQKSSAATNYATGPKIKESPGNEEYRLRLIQSLNQRPPIAQRQCQNLGLSVFQFFPSATNATFRITCNTQGFAEAHPNDS